MSIISYPSILFFFFSSFIAPDADECSRGRSTILNTYSVAYSPGRASHSYSSNSRNSSSFSFSVVAILRQIPAADLLAHAECWYLIYSDAEGIYKQALQRPSGGPPHLLFRCKDAGPHPEFHPSLVRNKRGDDRA
ncbi:hypothetical protein BJ912DRAFT_1050127 [Pholiota molesta]|nr:hypothetical protein BJ912DRAFT_1050127 [Pholiota molesta]